MRIPEPRKNKGILRQRFPAVVSGPLGLFKDGDAVYGHAFVSSP